MESNGAKLFSILIPVYNERIFLRRCVERVLASPLPNGVSREVVLVNDASTDGTRQIVDELAASHPGVIRAFHQDYNQGKGAAIKRAISEMRGQYAIFQDADTEYDANEYSRLLKPILEGRADVVYGSRFAACPERRVLNYHHTLGNLFLTHMSNFFTGLHLTDMETCYKVFRADLLKTIPLHNKRFGIEPELTAKIAKRDCVIYEVPISYHGRSYMEGKKIGWKDGVSAIYNIIKYWLIDDCYDERYGRELLQDISRSRRFIDWVAREVRPFLGQRILELGCGIGNFSRHLPKRELLTVSDSDDVFLDLMRDAYRGCENVEIRKLNLLTGEGDNIPSGLHDTVICLHGVAQAKDDLAVLKRIRQLLAPGGKAVLMLPQHPSLYGGHDRNLGHCRRYTRAGVCRLLHESGFRVCRLRDINSLGAAGWWINSSLLGRERMGKLQLKCLDLMMPAMRLAESLLPLPGLNLICVAEAV